METKHTPGPWCVDPLLNNRVIVSPRTSQADQICTCDCIPHGADDAEIDRRRQADARLIAAAPDLLASLRDMVRYEDLAASEQQPAVERARAAIAKAAAK